MMAMQRRMGTYLAAASLLFGAGAWAEEFPGGDAGGEFEKGFGEGTGISLSEKEETEKDRLKIGGSLWSEFFYGRLGGRQAEEGARSAFTNPNSLWLYLDSRLRNDVRAFVKARGIYTPTDEGGPTSSSRLEELKLMFNAKRTVFFTVGKQKLKWGSGRFWNPTDFINTMKRDLLYSDDRRPGISAIKTHVPIGSANLYLINTLDGASRADLLGHALRFELPVATAEVAFTGAVRKGRNPLYGVDFSTAVHDFDVYSELALSSGEDSRFFGPTGAYAKAGEMVAGLTTGLSYEYAYGDNDSVFFTAEYFRNGQGYDRPDDYAWPILAGAYQPYHLGRHYGLLMVSLPNPGRARDVSFSLLNLVNLTDRSGLAKVSALFSGLTGAQDLKLELGLTGYYGNPSGELKLARQLMDASVRLMVEF